jgi:predicted molibdopterin-dependent oxidoreductase YjgC
LSHHLTTCTFCGVGCGIYLETTNNEITGTYPSISHPANQGRICVRGWHVHEVASSPDRLKEPLVRKNGVLAPTSWDEAYDTIARRLNEIKTEHGPDAIGFLNSARCSNEDGYAFQKFARAVIGTNNVDQGTSPYRANSVEVLRDMVGIPAATNSIDDIFKSRVIILNQTDIGQQMPTAGGAIIRAHLGGAKLIVVDSRRHRVAEHADIFLNIKPASEEFLYAAMAKIIVDRGLMDLDFIRRYCDGYDHFLENIKNFDILFAAGRCDIPPALIEQAALEYARLRPAMLMYSTATEASGRDTIAAMINIALLTGNLGKEGAGILPLAEHNNVQGCCDMGMTPGYLPGYAAVTDAAARGNFEKKWGMALPSAIGLDGTGMLSEEGGLKAIWLDRHNPVVSATHCDAATALSKMDFVVSQNLFMTRTAEYAHVVLPTAAFGEENVTFTSMERRIQIAARVVEPKPRLPSAWEQVAEVARRMGAHWNFAKSEDVMREASELVTEYGAVSYENLAREYGRQWPCTPDRPLGTRFLFAYVTEGSAGAQGDAARRFRFRDLSPVLPEEPEAGQFPYILAFGQSLYYWHQNVFVQHSETLKREYGILLLDYPEGFVEINSDDAAALRVRDGQKLKLISPAGEAVAAARVTDEIRSGTVYVPYFLQAVTRQLRGACGTTAEQVVHVKMEKVS